MRLTAEYIAGFLDADGTIYGYFHRQYAFPACCPSVGVEVQFTGQNLAVLEEIRDTFGFGKIQPCRNNHASGAYRLYFSRRHTTVVLQTLLPFLRVKREQALVALAILQTINPRRGGRNRVTPEERLFRETQVQRLCELNAADSQAFRTKWVNSVKLSPVPDVARETIPSQTDDGPTETLKLA
jgi:hypothetical protein